MACEYLEQLRKAAILAAAKRKILKGEITVKRNARTGRLEILGLSAAERGPMGDACIIAGLAKQPDAAAALRRAGVNTTDAIRTHEHAHAHGIQH
jgi:hypothetical protein